jgi:hypothetical protein
MRISAKFDKLVTGHVDAQSSRDIKNTVRSLEHIQVSEHQRHEKTRPVSICGGRFIGL